MQTMHPTATSAGGGLVLANDPLHVLDPASSSGKLPNDTLSPLRSSLTGDARISRPDGTTEHETSSPNTARSPFPATPSDDDDRLSSVNLQSPVLDNMAIGDVSTRVLGQELRAEDAATLAFAARRVGNDVSSSPSLHDIRYPSPPVDSGSLLSRSASRPLLASEDHSRSSLDSTARGAHIDNNSVPEEVFNVSPRELFSVATAFFPLLLSPSLLWRSVIRPLFQRDKWPVWCIIASSLVTGVAFVVWRRESIAFIESVVDWCKDNRFPGFAALVGALVISCIPPIFGYSTILYLCGFIYGFPFGFVPGFTGAWLGSLVSFALFKAPFFSRLLNFQSLIPNWHAIKLIAQGSSLRLIVLVRLAPYPFNVMNVLFAQSGIPTSRYALATAISLFKTLLHIQIGATVGVIADLAGGHSSSGSRKPTIFEIIKLVVLVLSICLGITVAIYLSIVVNRVCEFMEETTSIDARASGNNIRGSSSEELFSVLSLTDEDAYDFIPEAEHLESKRAFIAMNNNRKVSGNGEKIPMIETKTDSRRKYGRGNQLRRNSDNSDESEVDDESETSPLTGDVMNSTNRHGSVNLQHGAVGYTLGESSRRTDLHRDVSDVGTGSSDKLIMGSRKYRTRNLRPQSIATEKGTIIGHQQTVPIITSPIIGSDDGRRSSVSSVTLSLHPSQAITSSTVIHHRRTSSTASNDETGHLERQLKRHSVQYFGNSSNVTGTRVHGSMTPGSPSPTKPGVKNMIYITNAPTTPTGQKSGDNVWLQPASPSISISSSVNGTTAEQGGSFFQTGSKPLHTIEDERSTTFVNGESPAPTLHRFSSFFEEFNVETTNALTNNNSVLISPTQAAINTAAAMTTFADGAQEHIQIVKNPQEVMDEIDNEDRVQRDSNYDGYRYIQ